MENTLENKAKFFAQYWGQYLIKWDGSSNHIRMVNETQFSDYYLRYNWIELIPISQISDEDAIELACRRGFLNIKNTKIDTQGYWVKFLGSEKTKFVFFTELYSEEVDYLRSKGYALPFHDLSVEEQIEYGWVKLKN